MLIRDTSWQKVRDYFTQAERDSLNCAITGQVICPFGYTVDLSKLPDELKAKMTMHGLIKPNVK